MAIVFPNGAEVLLLKYMLNYTSSSDLKLHLYTTNITPAETDTLATYSGSEPTDVSYAAETLTGTSWTVSTSLGVTSATYAGVTFTFAAGVTIYGAYLTDNADSNLIGAEKLTGAPFTIPSGGGSITINPSIQLD